MLKNVLNSADLANASSPQSSAIFRDAHSFCGKFIEQLRHIPSTLFKHYSAVANLDSRKLQHPQHSRNQYQQCRGKLTLFAKMIEYYF